MKGGKYFLIFLVALVSVERKFKLVWLSIMTAFYGFGNSPLCAIVTSSEISHSMIDKTGGEQV